MEHFCKGFWGIILIFSIFLVQFCNGATTEEDLTVTHDQKLALDEFRSIFETILPHEYMKKNIYLLPWLRVNNFDIPSAAKMLSENLRWRKEQKIDGILDEDWSDFDEYQLDIDGCDKEGRPTITIYVGSWDVRKLVLQGKSRRMTRYIDKIFEEATVVRRNMWANKALNATRINLIIDISGFSPAVHMCPRCIPLYIYLIHTWDRHFPQILQHVYILNVPSAALPFWDILKGFASRESRELIVLFGKNKNQWRRAFVEQYGFELNQIGVGIGGGKMKSTSIKVFRENGRNFNCSSDYGTENEVKDNEDYE